MPGNLMTEWPLNEEVMIRAVAERDASYDDHFVYGVTTTGVFCRPSCPSRRPRSQNVRFFPDAESARLAGFRNCKRCVPVGAEPPEQKMAQIAKFIESKADETLSLRLLAAKAGLSPSHFQRAFSRALGVSPKAYQEQARVRRLKTLLKQGCKVTEAIFESGYGSTSRVYGGAVRNLGMTPTAYRSGGVGESMSYVCCGTILGATMMAATDRGLCSVMFGDSEAELLQELRREFPNASLEPARPEEDQLQRWLMLLAAYLQDNGPRPEIPLDLRGTAFQTLVWRFLTSLDEGQCLSYGEVAKEIGKPSAVRAVASACAANRVAVLIPCHRVLRGDGGIGGYRWGSDRKHKLLEKERRSKSEPDTGSDHGD